ncbi:MAG: hypothetical protein RDA78_01020 [Roseibium sp.]|uniref:hypothetical protein n=1 Tax=Roseibium sp. TaxID=1936156 RepID=UPI003D9C4E62
MNEIRAALDGSWLLLRNRPEGQAYFDQSLQGFWRSFQVIILLIPLFLLSGQFEKHLFIAENMFHPEGFPDSAFWTSKFLEHGVNWIALPIILAAIAAPIGISQRYVPFIVVRNWTSLLTAVPYMITYILFLLGIISPGIAVLLSLTALLVILWYHFLIARIVLQASISLAIGVVVLDILLSLVIAQVAGILWRA